MHVGLKDLLERISIEIYDKKDGIQTFKSFAYIEALLEGVENKNFSKARVIFIFPKNKHLLSRPNGTICLHWKCKKYITFDVFTLTPHLLICLAFEDIASVQSSDSVQSSN